MTGAETQLREAMEALPPRRIRIAPHGLRSLLVLPGILATIAVAVWLAIAVFAQCSRTQEDSLLETGVQTEGRITGKSSRSRGFGRTPTATLSYAFEVDGRTYYGEKDYGDPFKQVGDTIVVTYEPSNPNQNREGILTQESVDARSDLATPLLLLLAIMLLLSLVLSGPGLLRLRRLAHLARIGRLASAQVEKASEIGIVYRAEGGKVTGRSTTRKVDGRFLVPGDQVLVVYDPEKPRRCALLLDMDDLEPIPAPSMS